MWYLLASAYGEDVYNNSQVYSSTTEVVADSGAGGLVDTGLFAAIFIVIGLSIIALTVIAQYKRRNTQYISR
jgi:hypothetical protein